MPGPKSQAVQQPDEQRSRQRFPDGAPITVSRPGAEPQPPARRERPQKRNDRPAEHEERRGHENENLVLRHMDGEENLTDRGDGRQKGEDERDPSGGEGAELPGTDPASAPGSRPEP